MNSTSAFYVLKQHVLSRYREEFPYATTDWKTFSGKDILQLIDSIETATKERVSEKWIYTHLKPAKNEKLPRKDMLDILAIYCHFTSWEMFIASQNRNIPETKNSNNKTVKNRKKKIFWLLLGTFILIMGIIFFFLKNQKTKQVQSKETEKISVKDFYTEEPIEDSTVQLFVKKDGKLKPLKLQKIPISAVEEKSEIIVESPFYTEAKVEIKNDETVIILKPDDHAMILKAFMQSDIKDWEIRKTQLDKILSDDLEVLIHLQNSLGIEYMNKTEFAQKLIIPTKAIKRWQILSLEQDELHRITKIRIMTK